MIQLNYSLFAQLSFVARNIFSYRSKRAEKTGNYFLLDIRKGAKEIKGRFSTSYLWLHLLVRSGFCYGSG